MGPFRYMVLALVALCVAVGVATATTDTLKADNGQASARTNPSDRWEQSVIFRPGRSIKLTKLLLYYVVAGTTDTVRITGDASEGTIPPTQYCFGYNTLATIPVEGIVAGRWIEIDISQHNIIVGGFDGIVVQHLLLPGGSAWAQDSDGRSASSFLYDPITPNPNFFNIPGIYYLANGDYLVRLIGERVSDVRPAPVFTDVTEQVGLLSATQSPIRADMASVVDWDGDGYDDVCVGGLFFKNTRAANGDRVFEKVSLPISSGPTSWADVDNDGDMDCFVAAGNGNDRLWRNNNGTFEDVTANTGYSNNAPTVTALWLDIENDGDLDLFIANGRREQNGQEVYFQDKLWRNNGNWQFTDVTASSGIAAAEPAPYFDTWGATLCDVNNDGFTDVFVATYRLAPDRLYKNNGNGTFTDIAAQSGAQGIPTTQPQYFGHGMGADWADIDNDGDADLVVGNLGHPDSRAQYSNPSLLLRSTGAVPTPRYENLTGIKFREMNSGVCFLDMDQDGRMDVWHGQISYEAYGAGADRPSHLYRGTGSIPPFDDVAWESGLFIHGAWTAVRLDYDRDGDLDLLCSSGTQNVKLFRNDVPKAAPSVTIRLQDVRNSANRTGYGAHVDVWSGTSRLRLWNPGTQSGGRMAQMTHDLHAALPSERVDSVVVHWPGGVSTTHKNIRPHSVVYCSSNGTTTDGTVVRSSQRSPAHGSLGNPTRVVLRWFTRAGVRTTVEIATNSALGGDVSSTTVDGDSLVLPNVANGRTLFWRVRAENDAEFSSTWSFTSGYPRPTLPQCVYPASSANGIPLSTTFRWHPARYAIPSEYLIEYSVTVVKTTSPSDTVFHRTGIKDTMVTVDGLPALTDLTWSVEARNQWHSGIQSPAVSFLTYGTPLPNALVYPANNAQDIPLRPRFHWNRMMFVDRGYELEIDTLESFATQLVRKASDTALTITPALKSNRTYFWRVRGVNQAGSGAPTEVWTFATSTATSVEEPSGGDNVVRYIAYDVLGRVCATGTLREVEEHLSSTNGVIVLVGVDAAGLPRTQRTVVR